MKFSIVIAALLGTMSVEQISAITLQKIEGDDPKVADPAIAAIRKKKKDIQEQIDEKTIPQPLSEDEEKAKLNKEIDTLAKTATKNGHKKKLDKLEAKIAENPEKAEKLAPLVEAAKKDIEADEEEETKAEVETKEVNKDEEVKDLKKTMADLNQKEAKEVNAIEHVKQVINSKFDVLKEKEQDPVVEEEKKVVVKKQAKMIDDDQAAADKVEEEKEARKAAIEPNEAIAASEAAVVKFDQEAAAKTQDDEDTAEAAARPVQEKAAVKERAKKAA